jgi:hypothetical protein
MSTNGGSQQSAPMLHGLNLFGPADRELIYAKHAAARGGLTMVQHSVGHDFGYACLPERGGEGATEIVPGPSIDAGLIAEGQLKLLEANNRTGRILI